MSIHVPSPAIDEIQRLEAQIAQRQGYGMQPPEDDIQAQIKQVEAQIAQFKTVNQQTPGFSGMDPSRMQDVYGLLAEYGDNPAQVGQQYVQAMQQNDMAGSANSVQPSNVREWTFYNSLSQADQKRYLEMKRGISLDTVAGNQVRLFGGEGLTSSEQFSSLEEEAIAERVMKSAGATGTNVASRYDILESGRQGRMENYRTAQRVRNLVAREDLPTGKYTGLIYKVIPKAEQESLDALAEFVARARLKASGEIRPTDADVVGMKRALFGSGRTEGFTVESLDRLIRELEAQEEEYNVLGGFLNSPGYRPTKSLKENYGGTAQPNINETLSNDELDRQLDAQYLNR